MKKVTVLFMMVLVIFSLIGYGQANERKVFAFYYPWYEYTTDTLGYPESVRHWHKRKDSSGDLVPIDWARFAFGDIGSSFYPALGLYSCNNEIPTNVISQHMAWMKEVGVDVIIVSWWGQGHYTDDQVPYILNEAKNKGLKVCFLIEPYDESSISVSRYLSDIDHIYESYGTKEAFFRVKRETKYSPNGGDIDRGVFFIFDSPKNPIPSEDWQGPLDSIRGKAGSDAIILQKANGPDEIWRLTEGHFDGLYTYKGETPLGGTGFSSLIDQVENGYNSIFCLGISPGYDDRGHRIPPSLGIVNPRKYEDEDGNVKYLYLDNWDYAIGIPSLSWAAIVTFNEWHEGTQIEPARFDPPMWAEGDPVPYLWGVMERVLDGYPNYVTYVGDFGLTGEASENAYLIKTQEKIYEFRRLKANFFTDNENPLLSESISFTDQSINNPTSWLWTFEGGTPSTSTVRNRTVTYNDVGTYNVTLTVNNSTGSDTETKIDYITVNYPKPTAPVIISPKNYQVINTRRPVFKWNPVDSDPPVTDYQIWIFTNNGTEVLKTRVDNVTQYQIESNLECNKTHYWQLRAYNEYGWGAWSSPEYFKTPAKPEAPVIIEPKDDEFTNTLNPVFKWNAAVSTLPVTNYKINIWILENDGTETEVLPPQQVGNVTQYQLGFNLECNKTYYWQVRACNQCWGPWSDPDGDIPNIPKAYFKTPGKPEAPVIIKPKDNETTNTLKPVFKWNPVDSILPVTNYQIWIFKNDGTEILKKQVGNVTQYQIEFNLECNNLEYNKAYYWKLRAYNECGWGDWSSPEYFKTPAKPEAPVIIKPKDDEFTNTLNPVFKWNAAVSPLPVTNYKIRIFEDNGTEVLPPQQVGNVTQYQIEFPLEFDKRYYWQVRACSQCWGPWSDPAYFKTPQKPYVPVIIKPKNNEVTNTKMPVFKWEAVNVTPAVTNYQINLYKSNGTLVLEKTLGNVIQYQIEFTLEANTTYKWQIRAKNDKGYSDWSSFAFFNTPN